MTGFVVSYNRCSHYDKTEYYGSACVCNNCIGVSYDICDTEDPVMGLNPGLYYKIQYMIAFRLCKEIRKWRGLIV